MRDHPRSRGVYLRVDASGLRGSRIIPARAGFTKDSAGKALIRRDHPRSRGVYLEVFDGAIAPDGSSPLARGLHVTEESP